MDQMPLPSTTGAPNEAQAISKGPIELVAHQRFIPLPLTSFQRKGVQPTDRDGLILEDAVQIPQPNTTVERLPSPNEYPTQTNQQLGAVQNQKDLVLTMDGIKSHHVERQKPIPNPRPIKFRASPTWAQTEKKVKLVRNCTAEELWGTFFEHGSNQVLIAWKPERSGEKEEQHRTFQVVLIRGTRKWHLVETALYLYTCFLLLGFLLCLFFTIAHSIFMEALVEKTFSATLSMFGMLPFLFTWSHVFGTAINMTVDLLLNGRTYAKTSFLAQWLVSTKAPTSNLVDAKSAVEDTKSVDDAIFLILVPVPALVFAFQVVFHDGFLDAILAAQHWSIYLAGGLLLLYIVDHLISRWKLIWVILRHMEFSCVQLFWVRFEFARSVVLLSSSDKKVEDDVPGPDIRDEVQRKECCNSRSLFRYLFEPQTPEIELLLLRDICLAWPSEKEERNLDWKASCTKCDEDLFSTSVRVAAYLVKSVLRFIIPGALIFVVVREFGPSTMFACFVVTLVYLRKLLGGFQRAFSSVQECSRTTSNWRTPTWMKALMGLVLPESPESPDIMIPTTRQGHYRAIIPFKLEKRCALVLFLVFVCLLLGGVISLVVVKKSDFAWVLVALISTCLAILFWVLDHDVWLHMYGKQLVGNIREAMPQDSHASQLFKELAGLGTQDASRESRHLFQLVWRNQKHKGIFILSLFSAAMYFFLLYRFSSSLGVDSENGFEEDIAVLPLSTFQNRTDSTRVNYPICSVDSVFLDRVPPELNLADYAFLSKLAYSRMEAAESLVSHFFESHDVQVRLVTNLPQVASQGPHTKLFHVSGSLLGNFTVVSIRGTTVDDWRDIAEDLGVWTPVVILQIFSWLLPFGDTWDGVIPTLLKFLNKLFFQDQYHLQVERQVRQLVEDGNKVVLTGHSLGGGIAMAVGARRELPTVCFSAPNHILNRELINVSDLQSLYANTLNVIPDGDVVPRVDKQPFHAQRIRCNHMSSSLFLLECHRIDNTFCELVENCSGFGNKTLSSCKQLKNPK